MAAIRVSQAMSPEVKVELPRLVPCGVTSNEVTRDNKVVRSAKDTVAQWNVRYLSRLSTCAHRHDRRSGTRHVRRLDELDWAHSIGRAARAGSDDGDALTDVAGPAERRRFFAWL